MRNSDVTSLTPRKRPGPLRQELQTKQFPHSACKKHRLSTQFSRQWKAPMKDVSFHSMTCQLQIPSTIANKSASWSSPTWKGATSSQAWIQSLKKWAPTMMLMLNTSRPIFAKVRFDSALWAAASQTSIQFMEQIALSTLRLATQLLYSHRQEFNVQEYCPRKELRVRTQQHFSRPRVEHVHQTKLQNLSSPTRLWPHQRWNQKARNLSQWVTTYRTSIGRPKVKLLEQTWRSRLIQHLSKSCHIASDRT